MRARMRPSAPMVARRDLLRGAGVAGTSLALGAGGVLGPRSAAAGGGGGGTRGPHGQARWLSPALLQGFEADVQAALGTFGLPGAAVALVEGAEVVYARGFGVRELNGQAPVTPRTRFRIGSNTKSMTALLLATFVDEGRLGWDTRASEAWPAFRAPTDELTRSLRVRDLLGMGSGVAESPTVEFFMSAGTVSALGLLRSVADLPVIAPPDTQYYYNNTLVSVAGFLGPLLQGTPPADLVPAYGALLRQRLFEPLGMADAAIGADPRPLGDDWAGAYTRDLFGRLSPLPFVSIDGVAPAGAGIASATDMARYLIMQMNGGVGADGRRIVSAAALAETHRPGIVVPPGAPNALPAAVLPDTTATHYCQGWFAQTFRDGRRLLWHAGGIDGAGSFMGFFPAERVGFVLLTNLEPLYSVVFNLSVRSSLLSRLFGLDRELPALLATAVAAFQQRRAELADQLRPVSPTEVAPHLGLYGDGFRVRLDAAGALWLEHDIRALPLLAHAEGDYIVADGPAVVAGKRVRFAVGPESRRVMTIEDFDPVLWLTGP